MKNGISLAEISPADFYRLSYPLRPDLYARMEDRFPGWPLLALDRENRVVCGHDYVSLLRRRGEGSCRGLRLDIPEGEGLLLNFGIKKLLSGLNLFEQFLFVRKVLPFFPAPEIQRRADLPFAVEEWLPDKLDMLLCPPFRPVLIADRIGPKSALKLLDMPRADCEALLEVLAAAAFTESQQLRLIELAEETAFARKERVSRVLSRAGVRRLLKREMPQKQILASLFRIRYPLFSEDETRWLEKIGKITAGGRLQVRRHPFAEKKEMEVVVRVVNGQQALRVLDILKKALPDG
jgi:hypothetical protein